MTHRHPQHAQEKDDVGRRFDVELWEDFIGKFFYPMLRSVLPELAQDADGSRPVVLLENELRHLARAPWSDGQNLSDFRKTAAVLAAVPRLSREDVWVLVHVEVPGRGGREDFPLRIYQRSCLIEGVYCHSVVGLALLVQPFPEDQEKGVYQWSRFGSEVFYECPVFRLYEGDEETLQKSDNPFDLAHYASIQAWKERDNDARKLAQMKILLEELDQRPWSSEKKINLLRFLGGIIHMEDQSLRDAWEEELKSREEGHVYLNLSLLERKGMEKEKIETVRAMLAEGEPEAKILRYARITPEQLRKIRRGADSLDR